MRTILLVTTLALAACAQYGDDDDDTFVVDADGGTPDASAPDATDPEPPCDAGPPDAPPPPVCWDEYQCQTLDFDTDAEGFAIAPGQVLHDAYAAWGVDLTVHRRLDWGRFGLGVAFDSDNPTGGDPDLGYDGLGNLLISQESYTAAEELAGFVAIPDDDACGAIFEFTLDEPACVESLDVLDLDYDEWAKLKLYDGSDEELLRELLPVTGDNGALTIEPGTCGVSRIVVKLSGSGAMDNLVLCRTVEVCE